MIKKICDRCKGEIQFTHYVIQKKMIWRGFIIPYEKNNLCEKCMDEFEKFFMMKQ